MLQPGAQEASDFKAMQEGKVNYKSNPGHLEPENLDSELYLFIYAFLDLFIFHAYVCEPAWVYVYPMCAQEPIEVRRGF